MCYPAIHIHYPDDISARPIRHFVVNRLRAILTSDAAASAIDDSGLIVAELLTNAVHAGTREATVVVIIHRDHIRLSVRDSAKGLPQRRPNRHPRPRPCDRRLTIASLGRHRHDKRETSLGRDLAAFLGHDQRRVQHPTERRPGTVPSPQCTAVKLATGLSSRRRRHDRPRRPPRRCPHVEGRQLPATQPRDRQAAQHRNPRHGRLEPTNRWPRFQASDRPHFRALPTSGQAQLVTQSQRTRPKARQALASNAAGPWMGQPAAASLACPRSAGGQPAAASLTAGVGFTRSAVTAQPDPHGYSSSRRNPR